jgi:4-hydroxy-4-methyl-2-oxoglutarate aldolase
MPHQNPLHAAELEKLRALDTCTVSNAIERLNVRLRNEGFVSGTVRCRFPNLPPMVGYAATGRVRTASPPATHRCYYDRMDWWSYVASVPEPRIMVLQDADQRPGFGAFVGEIHAAIGRALGCVGCLTNGAVRDLPAVRAVGFHLFAGSLAVSHSYAHIVEFGEPVEIGGLRVASGDLLHGDRHGVLNVPLEIAAKVPEQAQMILREERELVEFCGSPDFSLPELGERMKAASLSCEAPWWRC